MEFYKVRLKFSFIKHHSGYKSVYSRLSLGLGGQGKITISVILFAINTIPWSIGYYSPCYVIWQEMTKWRKGLFWLTAQGDIFHLDGEGKTTGAGV